MAKRIAQVIVLAEDRRQANLVRRYLERAHDIGSVRIFPFSGGAGSGEQWVRQHYPNEVKEHRNRMLKTKSGLIAVIDADTGTVDHRHRQLADALQATGEPPRSQSEAVAHVVPRRNVETWILCLTGRQVNEMDDYKHESGIDQKIRAASTKLYEWTRPNFVFPAHCPDSLSRAITELARIKS